VQQEYNKQRNEQDVIMEAYFVMPCSDRLQQTLKHMQQWLKQVEAGRTRQSLVKEAMAKIRKRKDSSWIRTPFSPCQIEK
jgi:hypothetical protein